jgi:hypothetical protein
MSQRLLCFTVVAGADLASHVDTIEYPEIYPYCLVLSLDQLDHPGLRHQVSFAWYGMARSYSEKEGGEA